MNGDVVSRNLSEEAANFQIPRRVVFYNGITNDYILSVEGICTTDLSSDRTYYTKYSKVERKRLTCCTT